MTIMSLRARVKPGLIGPPVNITVGDTTTGAAGTDASVAISGDPPDQTLSFTIPRGDTGATGATGSTGATGPAGPPGSATSNSTFSLTGIITPPQITSQQDNYNPSGLSTAAVLRLSTDASRDITGLAGGADGRVMIVHNVGAQNCVLKDDSASSAAENRFALTADLALTSDAVAVLQYDAAAGGGTGRWRAVSGGGGSSSNFVGDSGSGGVAGLVPAPAAGDAAAGKVLGAGGSFIEPASVMPGITSRIINGDMIIAQRATSATVTAGTAVPTASAGYPCVDRWWVQCAGANVTAAQVAGTGPDLFDLQITGAASVTAVRVGQRIENLNIADLASSRVMLAVNLSNSLLTTVTWRVLYANSANTFGTVGTPTETQIATGTWTVSSSKTRYFALIDLPSQAVNGVEVEFSVGAQTSGTWRIGRVRLGQVLAGATAEPKWAERLYRTEWDLCNHYYHLLGSRQGEMNAANTGFVMATNLDSMFANPTLAVVDSAGKIHRSGVAFYNISSLTSADINFIDMVPSTLPGAGVAMQLLMDAISASAEIP